jgi:hypothetical protein
MSFDKYGKRLLAPHNPHIIELSLYNDLKSKENTKYFNCYKVLNPVDSFKLTATLNQLKAPKAVLHSVAEGRKRGDKDLTFIHKKSPIKSSEQDEAYRRDFMAYSYKKDRVRDLRGGCLF